MRSPHTNEPRFLILTIHCGGGHLAAANAKIQNIVDTHPKAVIDCKDTLLDWFIYPFGKLMSGMYNKAQKNGNVSRQELLAKGQYLCECVVFIPFFLRCTYSLLTTDVDAIIDTQVLGTSAIIKAIRVAEFFGKKPIRYEKYITEIPTPAAKHFLSPLKRLSNKDRQYVHVFSQKPLLTTDIDDCAFWKTHARMPLSQITYSAPPIRNAFFDVEKKDSNAILIKTSSVYEYAQLSSLVGETGKSSPTHSEIAIHVKGTLAYIMLGARPQEKATKMYVDAFSEYAKIHKKTITLVVLCGAFSESSSALFSSICNIAKKSTPYITIIPCTTQSGLTIAKLFNTASFAVTRAGGLTTMEHIVASKGKVFIHCEHSIEESRKNMPSWERGNAEYLIQKLDASFITPATAKSALLRLTEN